MEKIPKDPTELRTHKRISWPFLSRFQLKPHRDHEPYANDWDMFTLKNLAPNGVLFRFFKPLAINSFIDMRIMFPAVSVQPIECTCRVIRVIKKERSSVFFTYEIAATFDRLPQETYRLLIDGVEHYHKMLKQGICIPSSVKSQVWMRDKAQCTICASRVDLSFCFKHPIDKEHRATASNTHLLCNKCRQAHSK
jgi:hypothetical protein